MSREAKRLAVVLDQDIGERGTGFPTPEMVDAKVPDDLHKPRKKRPVTKRIELLVDTHERFLRDVARFASVLDVVISDRVDTTLVITDEAFPRQIVASAASCD